MFIKILTQLLLLNKLVDFKKQNNLTFHTSIIVLEIFSTFQLSLRAVQLYYNVTKTRRSFNVFLKPYQKFQRVTFKI